MSPLQVLPLLISFTGLLKRPLISDGAGGGTSKVSSFLGKVSPLFNCWAFCSARNKLTLAVMSSTHVSNSLPPLYKAKSWGRTWNTNVSWWNWVWIQKLLCVEIYPWFNFRIWQAGKQFPHFHFQKLAKERIGVSGQQIWIIPDMRRKNLWHGLRIWIGQMQNCYPVLTCHLL